MSPSQPRAARLLLAVPLLASLACNPAAPVAPLRPKQHTPGRCALRLDPPDLAGRFAAPAFPLPLSQIVVDVTFDSSALVARLSNEVPPRVASGRGLGAGIAGKLSYVIEREPFAVALHDQGLVVSTVLNGDAELCKPLGPLGCVPYARCSPAALAKASIPLLLRPDYRVGPASVSIRVTRPCRISSFGIDATARIQRGADEQAARLRARINSMLPSFRSGAEALWFAMGVRVPLGVQSRLRVRPEQVVQGQPSQRGSLVRIPLGVRARVTVESREGPAVESPALSAPRYDETLAPGVSLDVPIEIDHETLSAELTRNLSSGRAASTPSAPAIVAARASGDREGLLLLLSLSGQTCGDVAFLARPAYDALSGRIILRAVRPVPSEARRVRVHAPQLDLDALALRVERNARISLPVLPDDIPEGLERAAHLLRPERGPDVRVRVESSHVDTVAVTDANVVIVTRLRGAAEVELR